ncbi:MAG: alpha/beta hydrolase family protein [Planctomycetota bacterium]|jgi:hypothetical protein
MYRRSTLTLACLGLLCSTASSQRRIEVLKFTNYDEKEVVANLYTVDKNEPTVICVELFQAVQESWNDWIPVFRRAGLNVLVLDARGVGPSALSQQEKDSLTHATQYHNMHRNLLQSVEELEKRGFDTTRIALLSSNFGSNILITAMSQAGSPFRVMAMMTPAITHYRHLDVTKEIKEWAGPPTYMVSAKETSPFMLRMAKDIEARTDTLKMEVVDGRAVGNKMINNVPDIEFKVRDFLVEHLMPRAHLQIPKFDESAAGSAGFANSILSISRQVDDVRYGFSAYVVGDELTIGPFVVGRFKGEARLTLGDRVVTMPMNSENTTKRVKVEVATGDGSETLDGIRKSNLSGMTSVDLLVSAASWLAEDSASLRIEFIPEAGRAIALPASGAGYEVHVIER